MRKALQRRVRRQNALTPDELLFAVKCTLGTTLGSPQMTTFVGGFLALRSHLSDLGMGSRVFSFSAAGSNTTAPYFNEQVQPFSLPTPSSGHPDAAIESKYTHANSEISASQTIKVRKRSES